MLPDVLRGFLTNMGLLSDKYLPPTHYKIPAAVSPVTALPPLTEPSLSWEGLVLHHSASPDGTTRDTDGIARYHMSYRIDGVVVSLLEFERRQAAKLGHKFEKPWKAIGYHRLIERIGLDLQLTTGRPLTVIGAHAAYGGNDYFNKKFIGLCVVGNYDTQPPSADLWSFTVRVVRQFQQRFGFSRDQVLGHRETYARLRVPPQKSCPGKMWDMDQFRAQL